MPRFLFRRLVLLLAVILPALAPISASRAQEFGKAIMTGGPSGTYIQFGRDLAALGQECGLNLDVVESAGSLENLVAVKKRVFTQFGIVQSDVLEYVQSYAANDPELGRSILGVRIMFPLYNEEVHILAKREIGSVSELAGRKVAMGVVDSGTYLTASLMLDIMQVEGAERLLISTDEALPMLMNGEIDAMFYVAGAPAKLFSDPAIHGSSLHLLSITEAPLLASYTKSSIAAGTYPFQPEAVDVAAVKAVLMTYDFEPTRNAYHQGSCKSVSDFANIVVTNLDRLREQGHPKWRNVDLTELPPGWRVAECVKDGMRADYQLACVPQAASLVRAEPAARAEVDQEYLNLLKQRFGDE